MSMAAAFSPTEGGNILSLSQEEIRELCADDKRMVQLTNHHRKSLASSPIQSDFRVLAFLIIEKKDGSLAVVRGANTEPSYIGGSICAERAALCSLRFFDNPIIRQVSVVTDSENPISPGVLCREYLTSAGRADTIVVIGNGDSTKIVRCFLSELYPHPYAYRGQTRKTLMNFAAEFSKTVSSPLVTSDTTGSGAVYQVMAAASAVNALDRYDYVHPLRFSAAVLFDDGTTESAWMLKGLEYGNTLDPVSQLVHVIERRNAANYCTPCHSSQLMFAAARTSVPPPAHRTMTSPTVATSENGTRSPPPATTTTTTSSSTTTTTTATITTAATTNTTNDDDADSNFSQIAVPLMIAMVDQFGVAHAPFAQARCLLTEYGYGSVKVLVHNAATGELEAHEAKVLVPQPVAKDGNATCSALTHDDF